MPGWVWPFLVLFMIIICVVGVVYAVRKALHASRIVGSLAQTVQNSLSTAQQNEDAVIQQAPAFTQPLSSSSERYAQAHAHVLERKASAHSRHLQRWQVWKHFNE